MNIEKLENDLLLKDKDLLLKDLEISSLKEQIKSLNEKSLLQLKIKNQKIAKYKHKIKNTTNFNT